MRILFKAQEMTRPLRSVLSGSGKKVWNIVQTSHERKEMVAFVKLEWRAIKGES